MLTDTTCQFFYYFCFMENNNVGKQAPGAGFPGPVQMDRPTIVRMIKSDLQSATLLLRGIYEDDSLVDILADRFYSNWLKNHPDPAQPELPLK